MSDQELRDIISSHPAMIGLPFSLTRKWISLDEDQETHLVKLSVYGKTLFLRCHSPLEVESQITDHFGERRNKAYHNALKNGCTQSIEDWRKETQALLEKNNFAYDH